MARPGVEGRVPDFYTSLPLERWPPQQVLANRFAGPVSWPYVDVYPMEATVEIPNADYSCLGNETGLIFPLRTG